MTIMMRELPGDMLEEILCRVPAMSLKRLRSTCKRWNRLFNDSRFTRKHLDKSPKQFQVLMLRTEYRICSMNVNLHHEIPSIEVTGELTLHSNSAEIIHNINRVFHCDGLLLCTLRKDTRIVVWNPCTGQTKWIQHRNCYKQIQDYTLGSSGNNGSYKILCYSSSHGGDNQEFEIYEINSSWRILEVIPNYCNLLYFRSGVSLKGKTYFFAADKNLYIGVSFDYTIEKFGRMCLPDQFPHGKDLALSVVREEKLSLLLHDMITSKTEIWVTNKIDDETKSVVSWSKILTVDYPPSDFFINFTFLVNEEKKVVVCCEDIFIIIDRSNFTSKEMIYIVGEDNRVTQVNFGGASEFGKSTIGSCGSILLNYVPSLVQIERGEGKRKRND